MNANIIILICIILFGAGAYIIKERMDKRIIRELINKAAFLTSMIKREVPDWAVLNNLPYEKLDRCRGLIADIFYQTFFTEKINFIGVENFLQEATKYITCNKKESLIKEIMKESISNIDTIKLFLEMAAFLEKQDEEADKTFVLISQAIHEKRGDALAKNFFEIFDKKIEKILEGVSEEKRSHILKMQWLIK